MDCRRAPRPDVRWLRERTKVPACTLAAPRWARAPRFGTFKTMNAFMLQRDAARDGEKIPTVFFALCTWYHLCASCHGLRSLIGEEHGAQGWYFRHCGSQTNGSYLFKTIERGKTDAFSEISVVRWGGAPAERAPHSKEKVTRVLSVRIEN